MDDEQVRAWAAAQGHPLLEALEWRQTAGGARLGFGDTVVVKVHPPREDADALVSRLVAATRLHQWLVAPLTTAVGSAPGGGPVTLWPRVPVLNPADVEGLPWGQLGAHLAGLHRASLPEGLPAPGGLARLERTLERVAADSMLGSLGTRLVEEARSASQRHTGAEFADLAGASTGPTGSGRHTFGLVHGDWHLGQLARMPDGWRLLDVDDLGVGDPAWDLGRPAGFWAAGVLGEPEWSAFLSGYRAAGGPAVPATGDPWPALDLPARCAVFIAAARAQRSPRHGADDDAARALLSACERM